MGGVWHCHCCRHQADVAHAYQVLRRGGVKEDKIITMMYDDIAHNEQNPHPGKLFNRPGGDNVYEGVKIVSDTSVTLTASSAAAIPITSPPRSRSSAAAVGGAACSGRSFADAQGAPPPLWLAGLLWRACERKELPGSAGWEPGG